MSCLRQKESVFPAEVVHFSATQLVCSSFWMKHSLTVVLILFLAVTGNMYEETHEVQSPVTHVLTFCRPKDDVNLFLENTQSSN
jgi:hypothetical protein